MNDLVSFRFLSFLSLHILLPSVVFSFVALCFASFLTLQDPNCISTWNGIPDTIMITLKLFTLQHCDNIIIMDIEDLYIVTMTTCFSPLSWTVLVSRKAYKDWIIGYIFFNLKSFRISSFFTLQIVNLCNYFLIIVCNHYSKEEKQHTLIYYDFCINQLKSV